MPQLNATGISPVITATDIEASVRFYTGGLGFDITEHHGDNGALQHVTLKAGGAEIGLSRDDFAKGRDRTKGTGMRLWISTDQDLALLAEQVKAAGYTVDGDPAPLPWGPLAFAVRDPDGIQITIANDT